PEAARRDCPHVRATTRRQAVELERRLPCRAGEAHRACTAGEIATRAVLEHHARRLPTRVDGDDEAGARGVDLDDLRRTDAGGGDGREGAILPARGGHG